MHGHVRSAEGAIQGNGDRRCADAISAAAMASLVARIPSLQLVRFPLDKFLILCADPRGGLTSPA